jgi:hypothetical protein
MTTLKTMERELVLDWRALQLDKVQLSKELALKAYYLKYKLYRQLKAWLQCQVPIS